MLAAQERTDPDSCLNRSRANEPLFVLCARDVLAPRVVAFWIELAKTAGVNKTKITDAEAIYKQMESWERKKTPD